MWIRNTGQRLTKIKCSLHVQKSGRRQRAVCPAPREPRPASPSYAAAKYTSVTWATQPSFSAFRNSKRSNKIWYIFLLFIKGDIIVANPGCLSRIRNFSIPDPGFKRFRIPDPDPPQRILNPKIVSKLSEI